MTKQQFQDEVIKNVKQVVNFIAERKYSKLHTVTNIDLVIHNSFKTQSEAIEKIMEWLEQQLQIWSEYGNKEIVIDHFQESYLEIHDVDDNNAYGVFRPHSYGENLDLLFEFSFSLEADHIVSQFSINI